MAKPDSATAIITNISKQMIPLNLLPANGDFYVHSQNVYLKPGQSATLPVSYLNESQITNLQAKRMLSRRGG